MEQEQVDFLCTVLENYPDGTTLFHVVETRWTRAPVRVLSGGVTLFEARFTSRRSYVYRAGSIVVGEFCTAERLNSPCLGYTVYLYVYLQPRHG